MKIGNFDLEKDGVFIIAELSANHGGKIEIAKETIKAAKDIGANAIKLQTYTADTLTLDCDNEDFIIKGGTLWDDRKLYDLYKEAYLPWEWHKDMILGSLESGIKYVGSEVMIGTSLEDHWEVVHATEKYKANVMIQRQRSSYKKCCLG